MGRALDWASEAWDHDPQVRSLINYFMGLLQEVFKYPAGGQDMSVKLLELRRTLLDPGRSGWEERYGSASGVSGRAMSGPSGGNGVSGYQCLPLQLHHYCHLAG